MRAIRVHRFGGPEVLRWEEVPDPGEPGPGQVRVRLEAVGVNPVDTYIRSGSYGPRDFPFTPGTDAAGVVESVGPGVYRPAPGDRVYCCGSLTGTYAQKALCDAEQVRALPEPVSFSQGAALHVPYSTAYRALFQRGGARSGERVLIHGASGAVGLAAVQLAGAAGLIVAGTAGTEAGRRLLTEQGAHQAMDHEEPSEGSFDLILEMLANVNLDRDLDLLAPGGRVVVIGSRGRIEIDPRKAMRKEADIRGVLLFCASRQEMANIHLALRRGLENGTLRPVVRTELPLCEAARAHELVLESGAGGKIVLLTAESQTPAP